MVDKNGVQVYNNILKTAQNADQLRINSVYFGRQTCLKSI